MTPERWRQIATIFDAALAHDEAERAAFVATSCGTDAELRREIESMIAAHQNAGRFGDTPLFALQTEVESLLDAQQRAGNFAERPPVDRIGASAAFTPAVNRGAPFGTYQIAECLGAGGMGEVYRARDTRLGRDVAIKVLPAAFVMDQERLSASSARRGSLRHSIIRTSVRFTVSRTSTASGRWCWSSSTARRSPIASPGARYHSPTRCRSRGRSPRHWKRRTRKGSSTAI
jgi:hypothetical protein